MVPCSEQIAISNYFTQRDRGGEFEGKSQNLLLWVVDTDKRKRNIEIRFNEGDVNSPFKRTQKTGLVLYIFLSYSKQKHLTKMLFIFHIFRIVNCT